MHRRFQQLLGQFLPFFMLGIALTMLFGLMIIFSYLLFWGVLIGGGLWLALLIKKTFFSPKKTPNMSDSPRGRIINHDEDE